MDAPMLLVEGGRHGFEGRVDGGAKLGRKHVGLVDAGWYHRSQGERDVRIKHRRPFVTVDGREAAAVLVRTVRLEAWSLGWGGQRFSVWDGG